MAKNSVLRPCQIIRHSVTECNSEARVYLPSTQAQKQKITRIRRSTVKEPDTILNINIPESLKFVEGEQFVLSEKFFNNQAIILLGTYTNMKLLRDAECWLMDGTFEVAPMCMRQLFTIHGRFERETVPLFYCLMSSKSKAAYFECFYELLKWACEWNISLRPKRIISDFEKASVSALKVFFPEAVYKGCLFHFGQIIWRQVQARGLSTKYGNSESFSLQIRMLKSLALVPAEDVILYYAELYKTFDADARKIGAWFKKNYLTGDIPKNKNVVPSPQYAPSFWTVSDVNNENFPRTQNSVEGWHRRLKSLVGKPHIGVYQLLSELGKESIVVKARMEKLKAGQPSQIIRKQVERNKKIFNIIRKRHDYDKISYLKNIAHNITLSK